MVRFILAVLASVLLSLLLLIAMFTRPEGRSSRTQGEAGPDPDWR